MSKSNRSEVKKGILGNKIFMVITLLACAVAAYFAFRLYIVDHGLNTDTLIASAENEINFKPIYVALEPFTVTLTPANPNDTGRILYIGLTLSVKDEQARQIIEDYLPELRSNLLELFSLQTANFLMSKNGKVELSQQIKQVIAKVFKGQRKIDVQDVFYNTFIVR